MQAIHVDGGRELRRLFENLPKRVRAKGMRQAVSAAATPVVKATKQGESGDAETRTLKKAITKKIKTYKGGGRTVAIIGAKKNVSGPAKNSGARGGAVVRRVPSRYFHLVEKGTAPHMVGARAHPGARGNHALADAWASTRDTAGAILLNKMKQVLETEAAKLAGER